MPGFTCDLARTPIPFEHPWEHTVGSGHAPLALRADWQQQLAQCHRELGFRHVRFHGLLCDQMGTLICQNNELLYSFFNADQIIDFLLSIGVHPFIELSFMPETLASGRTTVFHYRGNVTPPKDYAEWGTFIRKLVAHWVERYGAAEVSQWFFEVWNEPNLRSFWTGNQDDYFRLYRYTATAIKDVDSSLNVGGPATAQNAWIDAFLEFAAQNKLPADFVSTHYYPTDAFGQIGANTVTQLEHAPHHIMRQRAEEAHIQARGHPLYYTEWSISSNPRGPLHDHPFAAAFATRILMDVQDLVQGYSFWTFSDIFEENYFPSVPFQGGFGLLNLQGIPKPVYRAFQLLHRLGTELLPMQGTHNTVAGWVIRKDHAVTVLLVNQVPPRQSVQTEFVDVRLTNIAEPRTVYVERIDEEHCNPRRVWTDMGEPEYLSHRQVEQLNAASALVKEPLVWQSTDHAITFRIDLPPQAVAAVTLEFVEP